MESQSDTAVVVKRVGRRRKAPKPRRPLTIITDRFSVPCSTRTFIAKLVNNKGTHITPEAALLMLPDSYQTTFKNCVIKKQGSLCIKLYTNMTVQVTGAKDSDEFFSALKMIHYPSFVRHKLYSMECVMSNWTVTLTTSKIDLVSTLETINDNDVGCISYFQRGYPLVIKYKADCTYPKYTYTIDGVPGTLIGESHIDEAVSAISVEDDVVSAVEPVSEEFPVYKQVSMLMFNTGNCIVSAMTETAAIECTRFVLSRINELRPPCAGASCASVVSV